MLIENQHDYLPEGELVSIRRRPLPAEKIYSEAARSDFIVVSCNSTIAMVKRSFALPALL